MQVGTATLVQDYEVFYSEDDALDTGAEGYEAIWADYMKTGDFSKVPTKAGLEPTRWRLRHIRGQAKRMLQDLIRKTAVEGMISPTAAYLACQMGLVEVENLVGKDGREFVLDTQFDRDLKMKVLAEGTMQLIDTIDEGQLVNQLGIHVIMNMSLNPL
jgi:hypothetical protein